jgi:hypothetical protein
MQMHLPLTILRTIQEVRSQKLEVTISGRLKLATLLKTAKKILVGVLNPSSKSKILTSDF